ncbi:MAG: pirin family protein [Candidatus Thorarchaeota archaeon]|nr:pirin family protein [Candidatus Thorarchaeota archaeon]
MISVRRIKMILPSKQTNEGAGVSLKRVFGHQEVSQTDPFLLLDHFGSDNPDDYMAGFPWHPHRGIETITYMLDGRVEHGDSLGNEGIIESGDVQWMTAGSGIIHQEMPEKTDGLMAGFQLWANLPSSSKMMHPRYQEVKQSEIPTVQVSDKISVKVICGEVEGIKGPVQDIVTEPEYLDVTLHPNAVFKHPIKEDHNSFAYVIEGEGFFDEKMKEKIGTHNLVVLEDGDEIQITTTESKLRLLLISGKPIRESVAWSGPIVMNTQEELRIAFKEYRNGTFTKHD